MASELKPIEIAYTNYRGETSLRTITPQRVWFGSTKWHPEPQWLVTAYDHDKQAVRDFAFKDFNTHPAPAATDTGLVTVGHVTDEGLSKLREGGAACYLLSSQEGHAVVTRSQAEELLAAKRARAAEKERLRFEGDLDKWMKIIGAGITGYQPEAYALMDFACEELVKLRADNAAQAARIKELEAERSEWSEEFAKRGRAEASEGRALAQIADLKAQLAVMREALGDLVSWFSDPSEYGPWIIKSGKHGADDAVEHARAVLGGKPS